MKVWCALLNLFCAVGASAQFTPMFLQNGSYWSGGKSEVDFYNAEFARDGQPHQCELMMILTAKYVDAVALTPISDAKPPGALPVIELHQFATIPRGLVSEQRSITALWRMDSISLARISAVGNDGAGDIVKMVREHRTGAAVSWRYASYSYNGEVEQPEIASPDQTLFYDELPLRVRTLDFSKTSGDFEVQLAPTLQGAEKEFGGVKPAKISWKIAERQIDVDLRHAGGRDHFVLDRDFPFLLREWQMADGSRVRMKNSLRADYRNYLKNGDRERALKDPMLRHPD